MRKYIILLCIVIIAVIAIPLWDHFSRPKIRKLGGTVTSSINKVIHDESLPYECGVFYTQLTHYNIWNDDKKIAFTSCVYSETNQFDITNPVLSRCGQNLLGFSDSQYEWTAEIQSMCITSGDSPLVVKLLYDLSQGTVKLKNTGDVLPFNADYTLSLIHI